MNDSYRGPDQIRDEYADGELIDMDRFLTDRASGERLWVRVGEAEHRVLRFDPSDSCQVQIETPPGDEPEGWPAGTALTFVDTVGTDEGVELFYKRDEDAVAAGIAVGAAGDELDLRPVPLAELRDTLMSLCLDEHDDVEVSSAWRLAGGRRVVVVARFANGLRGMRCYDLDREGGR